MRRAELWWANLPSPQGPRPVLLLSRDSSYAVRDFVTIAPVTTHIRGIRVEVLVGPSEGLTKPSAINVDSIQTIPKAWLGRRLGVLNSSQTSLVDAAIRYALGMK